MEPFSQLGVSRAELLHPTTNQCISGYCSVVIWKIGSSDLQKSRQRIPSLSVAVVSPCPHSKKTEGSVFILSGDVCPVSLRRSCRPPGLSFRNTVLRDYLLKSTSLRCPLPTINQCLELWHNMGKSNKQRPIRTQPACV